MPAIKTEHLRKVYRDVIAVDDLNLSIEAGELFALLGVNGAGKTTTIKMLSCLCRPTGGDAFLSGKSVLRDTAAVKAIIGVSPQETAVAPNLSVQENLALMCGVHGFSKEKSAQKIAALAAQFGLDTVLKKRAGKLSGGWQRRLSIAMALIGEPEILFLDEPTLGLDVLARSDLWDAIRALKGTVTIVLTTHYMEEAEALSDRIGIRKDGKLLTVGTAQELKQAAIPASRRSRETVAGVELITQMTKGQNPAAASTVFERIAKDPAPKELVLLLDEVYTDPHKSETAAWMFDTDYEDLNRPEIRKIIVGGARYLDHKVRLLLAGVPREKIVCIRDPFETPRYVDTQGVQEIFVLHDVVFISRGRQVRDKIAEKLRAEREEGAVYGD